MKKYSLSKPWGPPLYPKSAAPSLRSHSMSRTLTTALDWSRLCCLHSMSTVPTTSLEWQTMIAVMAQG